MVAYTHIHIYIHTYMIDVSVRGSRSAGASTMVDTVFLYDTDESDYYDEVCTLR